MARTKEQRKADMLLTRIYVLTRKKLRQGAHPVITWEEMGLPFQHYLIGDLRQRGIVTYSGTGDGHTGFYLREHYQDLTLDELKALRQNGNC